MRFRDLRSKTLAFKKRIAIAFGDLKTSSGSKRVRLAVPRGQKLAIFFFKIGKFCHSLALISYSRSNLCNFWTVLFSAVLLWLPKDFPRGQGLRSGPLRSKTRRTKKLQNHPFPVWSWKYKKLPEKLQKWSFLANFVIFQYFFRIFGAKPEMGDFVISLAFGLLSGPKL